MRRIVVASAAAGAGGGALCAAACDASKGTAERGSDAADEPVSPVADAEVDAAESAPGDDAADGALWPPGCTPPDPIEYDAGADAAGCEYRVLLPCGRPEFLDTIWPPTCTMSEYECSLICTGVAAPATACEVANGFGCDVDAGAFVAADGAPIVIECDKCAGAGRRPPGLRRAARPRARDATGEYLARAAYLEAASVHAFAVLADELRSRGAPQSLVAAARASARDEIEHARALGLLARTRGAEPPAVRLSRAIPRSLAGLAADNAAEGCARETFGALVATWQATHARDERVRRAMVRIATDETRHAALAWWIDRWALPRLDDRARRRARARRRRGFQALRVEAKAPVAVAAAHALGLPSAETSLRMIDLLEAAVASR